MKRVAGMEAVHASAGREFGRDDPTSGMRPTRRARDWSTVLEMKALARWTLLVLLIFAGLPLAVSDALASPERTSVGLCKKGKKKRRARKARRGKRAKSKVTSGMIIEMVETGMSDDEIVRKAYAEGFLPTKPTLKAMKKKKVRKSLRLALRKGPPKTTVAAAKKGPQPIDLETEIDPAELDFDDLPPPEGMPAEIADKHQAAYDAKNGTESKPAKSGRRAVVRN